MFRQTIHRLPSNVHRLSSVVYRLSSLFQYMPTLLVSDKLTVCGLNTSTLILFSLGKLGGRMSKTKGFIGNVKKRKNPHNLQMLKMVLEGWIVLSTQYLERSEF